MLQLYLSASVRSADLRIAGGEPLTLRFGHLDPSSETSGVLKRLRNLGFYDGDVDDVADPELAGALVAFQRRYGLEISGIADDATRAKLQEVHDTINADTGLPPEERSD